MATRLRIIAVVTLSVAMVASGTAAIIWRVGVLPGKPARQPTAGDGDTALYARAREWPGYLASHSSREEKILRCGEFIEVLSHARSDVNEPREKAELARILDEQNEMLTSLIWPEGTIARAWAAYGDGRLQRAIWLLELLASNPNYLCPDVEIVLAYMRAHAGGLEPSLARLRQVAELEAYRDSDLAAYMIAWCHMRQANLQEARTTLEDFLAVYPNSRYRELAESQVRRLLPVTKSRRISAAP